MAFYYSLSPNFASCSDLCYDSGDGFCCLCDETWTCSSEPICSIQIGVGVDTTTISMNDASASDTEMDISLSAYGLNYWQVLLILTCVLIIVLIALAILALRCESRRFFGRNVRSPSASVQTVVDIDKVRRVRCARFDSSLEEVVVQ